MKRLLLLLCLLCIHKSKSQTYKTNFRVDICQCLQDEFATANNLDKKLSECFRSELTKYATFIDAEIKEENATLKFAKGAKARRDLELEFKSELIYSCDFYYNKIEKTRQETLLALREQDYRSELKRTNEFVALSPTNIAYLGRAGIYYYKIGDLDKAMSDVNRSIEFIKSLDKDSWPKSEKLLMALIFEEQKKYDQAIAIYDDLYRSVYDYQIAILRAIVNRKKAGNGNITISESIISQSSTIIVKEADANVSNQLKGRRNLNRTSTKKNQPSESSNDTKKSSTSDLKKLFKLDTSKKKKTKD